MAPGVSSTRSTDRQSKQPTAGEPTPDTLLGMLYDMMLIRRFEERTMQNYMQQRIQHKLRVKKALKKREGVKKQSYFKQISREKKEGVHY